MKKKYVVLILVVILALLAGAWFFYGAKLPTKENFDENTKEGVGIANPASSFCIDNGGKSEIRTDSTGGQVGFCIFKDNSECEEWAYFREECNIGDRQKAE